jgi:hypothetical protein
MICLSQSVFANGDKVFRWRQALRGCGPHRSENIETNQNLIKDGVFSMTSFGVARDLMPQAARKIRFNPKIILRRGATGPRLTASTDGAMMMTRFTAP